MDKNILALALALWASGNVAAFEVEYAKIAERDIARLRQCIEAQEQCADVI